jgi:hypothetical protein
VIKGRSRVVSMMLARGPKVLARDPKVLAGARA